MKIYFFPCSFPFLFGSGGKNDEIIPEDADENFREHRS